MLPRFEGELKLRFLDEPVDGKWFCTLNGFSYYCASGYSFYVCEGTYTDFASVPKPLRGIVSQVGKFGKAAVLHDYLCSS